MNPLRSDLKSAAKDIDVAVRHLLLIDIDATRSEKGELSATNAEKRAAHELGMVVAKWLYVRGWPFPIVIDSGNGVHLLFWIDLPNDAASHDLVKSVLTRLAKQFNTDSAKVDTTVHNAPDLEATVHQGQERPEYGRAAAPTGNGGRCPDESRIVTKDMLEALVEDLGERTAIQDEAKPQPTSGNPSSSQREKRASLSRR